MGKNLKGRELGKGLSQRKNGLYSVRFTTSDGRRVEKYFKTITEARNYQADLERAPKTVPEAPAQETMTVTDFFERFVGKIISDRAPNTLRNYRERYYRNIYPVIGSKPLTAVKPEDCSEILNNMDEEYAGSTIRQTYICMGTMFKAAVMNDLLPKHPMDGVQFKKPVRAVNDIRYLTREEQERFLEVARKSHNYPQYALILETGLRTGELIGLTWDAINWEKRTLTVNKTLEFRYKQANWRAGPTKSTSSYRTIPLTSRAYDILRNLYETRHLRRESPDLDQTLTYLDRRSGRKMEMNMRDLVFVNFRTGMPGKNSSYDTHLYKLCDRAGIKRFSMHALRHTYATRAIEAGICFKTLQKFLGHSSCKMTLDRYVHVTDDSQDLAITQFEMAYGGSSASPSLDT